MKRVLAISKALSKTLPLVLMVAGCSAPSDGAGFMSRVDGATPLVQPVTGPDAAGDGAGMSDALLLLPIEAGPVSRIRERHFPNGTRQEIVLSGAPQGENVLDVSIRTNGSDQVGRGMLQIGRPSERGVRSEIVSRFPDVRMSIVTRPMRNALGDFGLAIGRHANGSRCVFAWQWIEDIREASPHTSSFTKMGALFSPNTTSVSIRIRLCRNEATVDDLAGLVEGMQLGQASAMERLMRLDRRSFAGGGVTQELGGRASGEIVPVGSLESAIAGPAPQRVVASAPASKVAPKVASKPVRVAARPAATRPAPKRAAKSATKPARVKVAARPAPEPQYSPGGVRYMAPMGGDPAPGSVSAIVPARGGRQLDPSLPMAAYRGPGASRGAALGAATQPMR